MVGKSLVKEYENEKKSIKKIETKYKEKCGDLKKKI